MPLRIAFDLVTLFAGRLGAEAADVMLQRIALAAIGRVEQLRAILLQFQALFAHRDHGVGAQVRVTNLSHSVADFEGVLHDILPRFLPGTTKLYRLTIAITSIFAKFFIPANVLHFSHDETSGESYALGSGRQTRLYLDAQKSGFVSAQRRRDALSGKAPCRLSLRVRRVPNRRLTDGQARQNELPARSRDLAPAPQRSSAPRGLKRATDSHLQPAFLRVFAQSSPTFLSAFRARGSSWDSARRTNPRTIENERSRSVP